MVATTDKKPNKTSFVTGLLEQNPKANLKAVQAEWTAAGHPGSVSHTLVSKLRADMGLAGNIRPRTKAVVAGATAPKKKIGKSSVKARTRNNGESSDRTQGSPVSSSKTKSQGKSSFIKEVLFDNPKANATAVNVAWKKAGMEGTISDSLVNSMRSQLNLTGNLRKTSKTSSAGNKVQATKSKPAKSEKAAKIAPTAATTSVPKSRATSLDRVLVEVEGGLDRLIHRLIEVGGLLDIEDALRAVRRRVIRSHKA
jgi:hypothetical protein